ncbi:hypothetical protein ACHAPI_011811 [Fusarium lateritium]
MSESHQSHFAEGGGVPVEERFAVSDDSGGRSEGKDDLVKSVEESDRVDETDGESKEESKEESQEESEKISATENK